MDNVVNNEVRAENIQRLNKIYKDIDYINTQTADGIDSALNDETKRKAIYNTIGDIAEALKRVSKSGDSDIIALFNQDDLKRIIGTRNFIAHNDDNVSRSKVANVIKYDLRRVGGVANNTINEIEVRAKTHSPQQENNATALILTISMLFIGSLAVIGFGSPIVIACFAIGVISLFLMWLVVRELNKHSASKVPSKTQKTKSWINLHPTDPKVLAHIEWLKDPHNDAGHPSSPWYNSSQD